MSAEGSGATPNSPDIWTIGRILTWTQGYFGTRKLSSPRLDAELLLAMLLQCNRVHLYTHYDQPLTQTERQQYRALVQRRARGEPVAYICGEREFYSRAFAVTPAVLIPRPETEHVVELALAWLKETGCTAPRILDLGTGSGALAITLAAELPDAVVWATDISAAALQVAAANAARHDVTARITLAQGDLFAVPGLSAAAPFDLIVSNPPYVETTVRAQLAPDVRDYEPELALFAGADGLDIIRRLVPAVRPHLKPTGLFLCEIGAPQGDAVQALLAAHGPWQRLEIHPDLQGHPRVALAQLGPAVSPPVDHA